MTYAVSGALQSAIYEALQTDPALTALVGDAVYDTVPAGPRAEVYVSLGAEQVRDQSDGTGNGALHELVIRVVSEQSGFARAKQVAAVVSDVLHNADLTLSRGVLVFLHFSKARAQRARTGTARQIDLTFRARICDGAPVTP
ncbi:hypothetical protein FHS72_001689 [Loktanella ponticola]|uniref:DUF3168 domain-containing protein n=1 Tax=Yoonia ponticola TaxID=1524255 RepID=A0A7W9EZE5_9RHOB|nr:DUF3168 domain-containing protein [Yoonia ponticola]MBB5722065.1 hypothetical protein [Yoonia ponticola]